MKLMKKSIKEILGNVESSTETIDENIINEFINTLTKSKNVFVMGAGRSGFVARAFAMRLVQLGINAYVVGETISPAIHADDCMLAVSGSGETKTLVYSVDIAKNIGSKILALTSYPDSSLGKLADCVMLVRGRTKNEINGGDFIKRQIIGNYISLTPLGTIFELTSMILLDGLISELMQKLNKNESDLKHRHTVLE